jgi:hypothetical protein
LQQAKVNDEFSQFQVAHVRYTKGDKMKPWLIAVPFLFATSLATAAEQPQQDVQPDTAMTTAKVSYVNKHKHSVRHLPRGDLRYCLELKDNEAIIRCAETGRQK